MHKIRLRPVKIEDAKDLFEYGSNEQVTKYLSWGPYKSINEAILSIENIFLKDPQKLIKYAIESRTNNKMIGTISIVKMFDKKIFIGYVLNHKFQNQGIMSKVLPLFLIKVQKKYPDHQIFAEVDKRNLPSLKLLLKNNFKIVGDTVLKNCKQFKSEKPAKLLKFTIK